MTDFLATDQYTGDLLPIPHCWIQLPTSLYDQDDGKVFFYALPEFKDAKSIKWNEHEIPGRPAPIKMYGGSGNRSIGATLHLFVTKMSDIKKNLKIIRALAALMHPVKQIGSNQYMPPYICRIKFAKTLSDDELGVPVVLKDHNVTYENTTQWFYDEQNEIYMPLHLSISTDWDVVYSWEQLPGADDVIKGNY